MLKFIKKWKENRRRKLAAAIVEIETQFHKIFQETAELEKTVLDIRKTTPDFGNVHEQRIINKSFKAMDPNLRVLIKLRSIEKRLRKKLYRALK